MSLSCKTINSKLCNETIKTCHSPPLHILSHLFLLSYCPSHNDTVMLDYCYSLLTLPTSTIFHNHSAARAIFLNYLHAHHIPSFKTKLDTNQPFSGSLSEFSPTFRPLIFWLQSSFPTGMLLLHSKNL